MGLLKRRYMKKIELKANEIYFGKLGCGAVLLFQAIYDDYISCYNNHNGYVLVCIHLIKKIKKGNSTSIDCMGYPDDCLLNSKNIELNLFFKNIKPAGKILLTEKI